MQSVPALEILPAGGGGRLLPEYRIEVIAGMDNQFNRAFF